MRYEVGQVYRAAIKGSTTFVVVTSVILPSSQGDIGEGRYRVRNLKDTPEEFEILESTISGRVKFGELCTWFLKQKWDVNDIANYLNEYSVSFRHSTLSAYCSNYQNYGDCNGPPKKNREVEDRPKDVNEESHTNKLAGLNALVQACGGINKTHFCLKLIEQVGGVSQVRQVINLLAAK